MEEAYSTPPTYVGRFAPSPTGLLHAGSMAAALASWLDARAAGGTWLVRIEDVDTPRCIPGAGQAILRQLADCGLRPDAPPAWQSQRGTLYRQALDRLLDTGLAYPCACSRRDIAHALAAHGAATARHAAPVYPGTCRSGLHGRAARAWRLRTDLLEARSPGGPRLHWHDRRLGPQSQQVNAEVGDFILLRADGLWAYQLAVVVDDAAQGITHVVRGQDLADNTPRQILLQRALGLPTPAYLHTPLVHGADGEKLSKQNGAAPVDTAADPMGALCAAADVLALPPRPADAAPAAALAAWTQAWRARHSAYNPPP